MSSTIFYFLFIPFLAFVLLFINLILAPHNPYQEKKSVFECGYHSFLGQNRTQFSISFFMFALLFLLFDLELLLVYPFIVSAYTNSIYGLFIMLIFFVALTIGLGYELGKKALRIESIGTTYIPSIFVSPKKSNINMLGGSYESIIVLALAWFFSLISFILLFIIYHNTFVKVLESKCMVNRLPVGFLSEIRNKARVVEKIRAMLNKNYLVYLPLIILPVILNCIYFLIYYTTILHGSSSFYLILLYTLIVCVYYRAVSCFITKKPFFTEMTVYCLAYAAILGVCVRVSLSYAFPFLLSVLHFYLPLDKYTSECDVYSSSDSNKLSDIFKSSKRFLYHIPILNKFMFLLHERQANYFNLEINKHKNSNFFLEKKSLIAKPRLSVPIDIIYHTKANASYIINPLLKSEVVFKSYFYMLNNNSNCVHVYSVSVCNYSNLHASVMRVKDIGILPKNSNFPFAQGQIGRNSFTKLVTVNNSNVELEKSRFILYPNNFKLEKLDVSYNIITCTRPETSFGLENFISSSFNNNKKQILDEFAFEDTPIIPKNVDKKYDFLCNKGLTKNRYLNDIVNNIPYDIKNPTVYMMRNRNNLSAEYKTPAVPNIWSFNFPDIYDPDQLEQALISFHIAVSSFALGDDEDTTFELVGKNPQFTAICFYFNELDRADFAVEFMNKYWDILMQQGHLPDDLKNIIEPLLLQYESFFDQEGSDLVSRYKSLENVQEYLYTDEFNQNFDFISNLQKDIGIEFMNNVNNLSSNEYIYELLKKENRDNFVEKGKKYFQDLFEKERREEQGEEQKEEQREERKEERKEEQRDNENPANEELNEREQTLERQRLEKNARKRERRAQLLNNPETRESYLESERRRHRELRGEFREGGGRQEARESYLESERQRKRRKP